LGKARDIEYFLYQFTGFAHDCVSRDRTGNGTLSQLETIASVPAYGHETLTEVAQQRPFAFDSWRDSCNHRGLPLPRERRTFSCVLGKAAIVDFTHLPHNCGTILWLLGHDRSEVLDKEEDAGATLMQ